jgi:hypothetical protein
MALDPRTLPAGPGLSFGDNVAAWADNFALWLAAPLNVDQFAAVADSAAATAVTSPQAPGEVAHAAGQVIDAAGNVLGDAEKAAANTALTFAAWGAAALVGVLLFQRMERG